MDIEIDSILDLIMLTDRSLFFLFLHLEFYSRCFFMYKSNVSLSIAPPIINIASIRVLVNTIS